MAEQNLEELFERILAAMRELSTQVDVGSYRNLTSSMMTDVVPLALRLRCDPARRLDPQTKRFLDESSQMITQLIGHIKYYITLVEDWFYGEWTHEEWVTACRDRSAIAFLFELYQHTDLQIFFPDLKDRTEIIDQLLRQKVDQGVNTPYHKIPAGTPNSHWWWWYPQDAPPHGKPCE